MSVLVDTSVWSEALRRRTGPPSNASLELEQLIRDHRVIMMGPIRQELLSGIRDERQFERLREHLAAFPDVSLHAGDYVTAATFFNACRAVGIQGSNTDFLICAVSVRLKVPIFTSDRDFHDFAEILPLSLHS